MNKKAANVAIYITNKSGAITKKIIPGTWANKYINSATGKLDMTAEGVTNFATNVLHHGPGEIQNIAVHPIANANSALNATDKWANK